MGINRVASTFCRSISLSIGLLALVWGTSVFAGEPTGAHTETGSVRAERWWNSLNASEMSAVILGDDWESESAEAISATQKPYKDLGKETLNQVYELADTLYGGGGFNSVGEWWETLNCMYMRIAAGDGNETNSSSAFCAHYPGSGSSKILGDPALAQVNKVGQALLGVSSPGTYHPYDPIAARWWNALNAEQMTYSLFGNSPSVYERQVSQKPYAGLNNLTRAMVNDQTEELLGEGMHASVGAWWETLDCRLMRIAVGDGNVARSTSKFCAHYPGSGSHKILDSNRREVVDRIGVALLGLDEPGSYYPPDVDRASRWWHTLNAPQMAAALFGDMPTSHEHSLAAKAYDNLLPAEKARVNDISGRLAGSGYYDSVGEWWETLNCMYMRIATGDGNEANPSSAFCAHYPGSGAAKILGDEEKAFVDTVGLALLGRTDIGEFVVAEHNASAKRWWNQLNADQMVAALHGDSASEEQMAAAQMPYRKLNDSTRYLVNKAAMSIGTHEKFLSIGYWWESLDCQLMRVAAGDGNTADASSPFCAHYPGASSPKILGHEEKALVDRIGMAIWQKKSPGEFPIERSVVAERWWNSLDAEQMVAALFGDEATTEEAASAKKMYDDLDAMTRSLVNNATHSIYGSGKHNSVGAWWETLNCQLMRVAVGDGNSADPTSQFCAHYPGSGSSKILNEDALAEVNRVGLALLARDEPGDYMASASAYAPHTAAARWWDSLNGEQMVATLFGDSATPEQRDAAKKPYMDLDNSTRSLVNMTASRIYGEGDYLSVGVWWETLNCELMRIAAGDGNVANPESPFCAHYPRSGAAKILEMEQVEHVNKVGQALLGLESPGMYPAKQSSVARRWWNALNADQMVASLYGADATAYQDQAARAPYQNLDDHRRSLVNANLYEIYRSESDYGSVGTWWETLDCRLMRIAVGDGNMADPSSPFCAHYPGTGAAKLLGDYALKRVNHVGSQLLGVDEPGEFEPSDSPRAKAWWSSLGAEQMARAIYGIWYSKEQFALTARKYDELDAKHKGTVNDLAATLYGAGGHSSVGAWWETLNCKLMRVAVGDHHAAGSSPYCAHYPGSGLTRILGPDEVGVVNKVGMALLGREMPGEFPINSAPMVAIPIDDMHLNTSARMTVWLNGVFTDKEGKATVTSVETSDEMVAAVWLSDDASYLTIDPLSSGSATITVTAMDSEGAAGHESFEVEVNAIPSIDMAVEHMVVELGMMKTFDISNVFDDDGELTISVASNDESVATFELEGDLMATLHGVQAGTTYVLITAKDDKYTSVTASFKVDVSTRPTVSMMIPNQMVDVGEVKSIDLNLHFEDADEGAVLTMTASSSDMSIVSTSVDSSNVLAITGVAGGDAEVTVTAMDQFGLDVSTSFAVSVDSMPMVASAIGDVTLEVGGSPVSIDLTPAFSDADGDTLTYSVSMGSSSAVSASMSGAMVSLTGNHRGSTTATATASDEDGFSVSQTFNVRVSDAELLKVAQLAMGAFGNAVLSSATDALDGRLNSKLRDSGSASLNNLESLLMPFGQANLSNSSFTTQPHLNQQDLSYGAMNADSYRSPSQRSPIGMFTLPKNFSMNVGGDGSAWTIWGGGSVQDVSSDSVDGSVSSLNVGADIQTSDSVLVGGAIMRSAGQVDFSYGTASRELDANLTYLMPYVNINQGDATRFWGAFGFGSGSGEINGASIADESDLSSTLLLVGVSRELNSSSSYSIRGHGDFGSIDLSTDNASQGGLFDSGLDSSVSRVRAGVESVFNSSGGVQPFIDLSFRSDSGDVEEGSGLEISGGLRIAEAGRFSLEAKGRTFSSSSDGDYKESGFSVNAAFCSAANGTGLSFEVSPSWGADANSNRLYVGNDVVQRRLAEFSSNHVDYGKAISSRVSYGMQSLGQRYLLVPYVDASWEESGYSRSTLGLNLTAANQQSNGLQLNLEAGSFTDRVGRSSQGFRLNLGFPIP